MPDHRIHPSSLLTSPSSKSRHVVFAAAPLVAAGRHARSGLVRAILGETSTELLLSADADVLVTPPEP